MIVFGSLNSRSSPFQGSGNLASHSTVILSRNLSRTPILARASAFVSAVPPRRATTLVIFVSQVPSGQTPEPVIFKASIVPRID